MTTRSMFNHRLGLPLAGALAAGWPLGSAAQGLGQTVDATIRDPAGQNIQRAAVAHVVNLIITLAFWFGVLGLVALIGVGLYGLVAARGDEDRREQAGRRVRWGVIGLAALILLGTVGWFLFYR